MPGWRGAGPRPPERGRNARQVARTLDKYREQGNLGVGVPLDNGSHGVLRVVFSSNAQQSMQVLDKQLADNLVTIEP